WLSHNLGRAEGTRSCNIRRRKSHRRTATAALHLQGILGEKAQLIRSEIEIGFVGALLNLSRTGRDRFLTTAVGTSQTAVLGFKLQVGGATGAWVAVHLCRRY